MAGRILRGGILALLDLIEEHRGAIEYDFRTRFSGLPAGIYSVPEAMGWGEALRLVRILRSDPSSQIATAVEEWKYPLSREAAIFADLYDLEYAKTGAKGRKPYPRPFDTKGSTQTWGNAGGRSVDEVLSILHSHGRGVN